MSLSSNVRKYTRRPSLENFKLILDLVTPEMMRGGCNPDDYGKGEFVFTNVVDIAMVFKGYKPMCWVSQYDIFPYMDELKFKFHRIIKIV